jgi:hypothetical protein
MNPVLRSEYALAALIIAVSLITLAPARAAPSIQIQPITITASGQATRITDSGISGPATLTLTASAYNDSTHTLQIQNATGTIQIGSTNYTLTDGHGNANTLGDIFVMADASQGAGQIYLHGTLQGNNVAFVSPESRLGSLASLALNGAITTGNSPATSPLGVGTASSSNSITIATESSTTTANAATNSSASNATQTTYSYSTIHFTQSNMTMANSSVTLPAFNATQTTSMNTTQTSQTNVTALVRITGSNSTVASSVGNQTIPYSSGDSGNVTVTVTRTVPTITINNTVTVTVANVTDTQTNTTSTVKATTTVTSP